MMHVNIQGRIETRIPLDMTVVSAGIDRLMTEFKSKVKEIHEVDVEVQHAIDEQNQRILVQEYSSARGVATYEVYNTTEGYRFCRILS